ncbi:MAG: lactate utilization protein [Anaerolineae bacterium]|nr:lactate utilization protein [Anaerolineae bacterium]
MSSRNHILKQLRAVPPPFGAVPPITERRPMVPLADTAPQALYQRFVKEAEKLGCRVYPVADAAALIDQVQRLVQGQARVSAWAAEHLPVPGVIAALEQAGIAISGAGDAGVSYGITGVDAALAATGSLLLQSGAGKHRTVSLLPETHIMLLRADQIIPDLETWFARQQAAGLDAFRQVANTVIISGPSKTADIAQELILGAHGPKALHLVILSPAG